MDEHNFGFVLPKTFIDLTNIERVEFEILRTLFPIGPGECAPALANVLGKLAVHSTMLSAVINDPDKKAQLGLEDLEAPRRHQRKIVAACKSLTQKLLRSNQETYVGLMILVARSNQLFIERGEEGIQALWGLASKPIAFDVDELMAMRPEHFDHRRVAEELKSFTQELTATIGGGIHGH